MVYALLSYAIHRLVVFPSFIRLERGEARKDMESCREALQREIHHLDTLVHDWAAWDDTYRFVEDVNPEYIESNLSPHTLMDNRVNLIYICDLTGKVIWKESRDETTGAPMNIVIFPDADLPRTHVLVDQQGIDSRVTGVMLTSQGPMLVSSRPIVKSLHQGPVRGFFIMGRLLDADYARILVEQTRVNHRFWTVIPGDAPEGDRDIIASISADSPFHFLEKSPDLLYVYSLFHDIHGQPALIIRADIPREIRSNAISAMGIVSISTGIAGLVILGVLFVLIRSVVIQPLSELTRCVTAMDFADTDRVPLFKGRTDEVGILHKEFKKMIQQLQRVQKGLEQTNTRLRREIRKRKRSGKMLIEQRNRLQALSCELLLTEELERRRLATDLHDQIGQSLALCQLKMDMMLQSKPFCCLLNELREVEEMIEKIIQQTRTLTFEISPPLLYEMGIGAALEWLAENIENRHGIRVTVSCQEAMRPLQDRINVLIFRTVRELLLNAVKHSKATFVTIEMWQEDQKMMIMVTDDGIGFQRGISMPNTGFGLFSIRERFFSIGGHFKIGSKPGQGVRASMILPIHTSSDLKPGENK